MDWRLNKTALVSLVVVCSAAAMHGQSALDGFDPNANGSINAVVVQPDGKILLGGDFTTLSPNGGVAVPRNYIARVNPDGTLDTAFNPNADHPVWSIAVQADGKILAGGYFTSIGGQPRNNIARLDATSGLADSFDPNPSASISSIVVQADGKILVAGAFDSVGGQTRNNIARLDPATSLADLFNPNANNSVYSIAVQADGKVLAGGLFTSIGGQSRNRIARLDATTGAADSFDPNANSTVFSIAVQADGKILVGGYLTSISGLRRNHIARLDAATGAADSFDPNANGQVRSIAVQADGKVLAGGVFQSIGGQTLSNIARLDATTGSADSFNPNAVGAVYSIAPQADGKILVGGFFTEFAPNGGPTVTRNRIARLEIDGRLDQTLNLSIVVPTPSPTPSSAPQHQLRDASVAPVQLDRYDYIGATAVQPNSKILIGGQFSNVLGLPRSNIARLNTDGTLDLAFNPNANGNVSSITMQADGKILAAGNFTTIGGQTRNNIARLDPITGLADSFDPNPNNGVASIAVQTDGKILVGGAFSTIGGQVRHFIARLDPITGLADSFNPNANSYGVWSIAVQADGKVLVGGHFSMIGGQTRNRIARLDATTGLADSFNPNAGSDVFSIALQADGKILAGGYFHTIGGQTRYHIARLDATTGLADSFDPSANEAVYSITVQGDGKVLVGGDFTSIGGHSRNHIGRLDPITGLADSFDPNPNSWGAAITLQADGKVLVGGNFSTIAGQSRGLFARLSNDSAALQNLAIVQSAITWSRGGSSPQFTHVTFDYSSDNVNYSPLGNGTMSGNDWMLTGLSLPAEQNFYIRASGYYRSGSGNDSESITESVRNAFLAPPSPTPTTTPCTTITWSEDFDELPVGTPAKCFYVSNVDPDTSPNDLFQPDDDGVDCCVYDFIGITIPTATAVLRFRNNFNVEYSDGVFWDGGVLEVSSPNISGGDFLDITDSHVGGSLVSGGYTGEIDGIANNCLSGRMAWAGNSKGYIDTVINLGANLAGQTVTLRFRFGASSGGPDAPGWRIDTMQITDGVCPTPTASPTSTPTATATATANITPTPTPTPSPTAAARALNLSTRMLIQTGDSVGIGGFIITGSGPKRVFLRAIGPSLSQFGVPNPLADPVLELHGPPGFETIINDNWGEGNPCGEIQICTICPQNPLESMICATLDPGAYTAIVRGNNNGSGVGLIEVYDLDTTPVSKLANISTRAFVSTGSDIMIAGFILGGGSEAPNVILRGIGPSLSDLGVPNALADPTLELRDDNGALLRANDNWQDDPQQAEILTAAGLALSDPNESGIAATLAPGQYTALVAGVDGDVGNGLVEAYDLGHSCPCPTPEPSPTATATATATVGASPSPSGPCVENWDSVTAPALPAGWVASNPDPGDGTMWATTTTMSESPPNNIFLFDQDGFSDKVLDRPGVNVTSANATLSFRNNFNTEFSNGTYWDGYMLEVSAPNISGGEFLDITDSRVGGSFVSGGYTGEICCGTCQPPAAAKRMAWSSNSGGYIDTVISLGPNLAGQTVTFRFRMCTNEAVAAPGVHIDNLVFTDAVCP